MSRETLTARRVEAIKPTAETFEVTDAVLPAMRLRVFPSGAKSFLVRTKVAGKSAVFTLGTTDVVSLAEARDKARAILSRVQAGEDPRQDAAAREAVKAARVAEAEQFRFDVLVETFLDKRVRGKLRSEAEIERVLTGFELAAWTDKDIREITKRDVLRLIDDAEVRGLTAATRTLVHLRTFMKWAIGRDLIDRDPRSAWRSPPLLDGAIGCSAMRRCGRVECRGRDGLSLRRRRANAAPDRRSA